MASKENANMSCNSFETYICQLCNRKCCLATAIIIEAMHTFNNLSYIHFIHGDEINWREYERAVFIDICNRIIQSKIEKYRLNESLVHACVEKFAYQQFSNFNGTLEDYIESLL